MLEVVVRSKQGVDLGEYANYKTRSKKHVIN